MSSLQALGAAALFLAVGTAVFVWLTLPTLSEARAVSTWTPVDAELISLELQERVDRETEAVTTSLVGAYRYTVDGTEHTSNRIGLYQGFDGSSWHADTLARLRAEETERELVTAWVDPADPTNAVLDRTVRWTQVAGRIVFPVLFWLVGLGLGVVGLRG